MEPSKTGELAAVFIRLHLREYGAYIKKVVVSCKQGFCSKFCIRDNMGLTSLYKTKFRFTLLRILGRRGFSGL